MASIEPGDFAVAVRCGNGWGLLPAKEPEADKYAVAVRAGAAWAAVRAGKPEVDKYALAIRQGNGWALAGLHDDDDGDEEPERLHCFIRNPFCSNIPCGPILGQGYTVLFSGWGGDLAGVNGARTFTWMEDCAWTVTDAGFEFYLTYPWGSGPYKWMILAYRLTDDATFSIGSPGTGPYEAEAMPLTPVYVDPRLDAGPGGPGIAVVLPP